jgi:hypothetical protein
MNSSRWVRLPRRRSTSRRAGHEVPEPWLEAVAWPTQPAEIDAASRDRSHPSQRTPQTGSTKREFRTDPAGVRNHAITPGQSLSCAPEPHRATPSAPPRARQNRRSVCRGPRAHMCRYVRRIRSASDDVLSRAFGALARRRQTGRRTMWAALMGSGSGHLVRLVATRVSFAYADGPGSRTSSPPGLSRHGSDACWISGS